MKVCRTWIFSIKTRVGFDEEEEWDALFSIYEKYPVRELIIHARDAVRIFIRISQDFRLTKKHMRKGRFRFVIMEIFLPGKIMYRYLGNFRIQNVICMDGG